MKRPTTIIEAPTYWGLTVRPIWIVVHMAVMGGLLVYAYHLDELLMGFYLVLGLGFASGLWTTMAGHHIQVVEAKRQRRLFKVLEYQELWRTLESWKEDSLSRRVLMSLHTQNAKSHQRRGSVDADPFLDAMLTRLTARATQVHETGSLCLSLAVLGTMAGLTLMLIHLQEFASTGALVAGDGGGDIFKQLFSHEGPLSALGTAFSTSLAGGAAKLVLTRLGNELHRGAEHITEHLADAIARDVKPSIERSIQ